MTFIDFFAGIGGFRRGLELAGHKCIGFCEFDKYAIASYTSMHLITDEQREYLATLDLKKRQKEILKDEYKNGEWFANDVRTVDPGTIPKADMWCFGFPCQDISVAGSAVGFRGSRSSLFFAVTDIIRRQAEENRPKYLLIENVKNLLSVNRGGDFAKLLIELDEIGYDAEWQVLNSKYFGVPQNRERCFIVGHFRGSSTTEVLPIQGADTKNRIHIIGHRNGYRRNTQIFDPNGITETLDTASGGVENLIPESNSWGGLGEAKSNNNTQFFQQDRVYEAEAIATSLTSGLPGGANLYGINIIGTLDEKRHSQMDVIGGGGIHPTLTTLNEKPKVGVSLSEILTHPVEG